MRNRMKIIKSLCFITAVFTTPILYAQTETQNQAQPYGDNPNIFRVLAHKTGEAVQNTAEKVGNATERGIQKIKPNLDETIENTKNYTTEQATIARDNTRQGIDSAVKKIEQTKDRITGKTSANIPIEHGSLSQSSTSANINTNTQTSPVPYTAPIVQNSPINSPTPQQPVQQQAPLNQSNLDAEPEIKRHSLPLENNSNSSDTNSNNADLKSTDVKNTNLNSTNSTKNSSHDEAGVPR